jgi:hypothetical protein
MSGYDYLREGSFLRPTSEAPQVIVKDDRVLIVTGGRHLSLTKEAAWELTASLSAEWLLAREVSE